MNKMIQDNKQMLVGLTLTSLVKGISMYFLSKRDKKQYTLVGEIKSLVMYPVKSCKGIYVDNFVCTETGPQNGVIKDRQWMVVSAETGQVIRVPQEPKLVLVTPEFHGNTLSLTAPNMDTLLLQIPTLENVANIYATKLWEQTVTGIDCGDKAAQWFSNYLNKPNKYRFVFSVPQLNQRDMHGFEKNYINRHAPGSKIDTFADFSQFSLVTTTSIEDLNFHLDTPVQADNFRMNLIVQGGSAFEEDSWNQIRIADVEMTKLKLAHRCAETTIDPKTGENLPSYEPMKTLRSYRLRSDIKGFGNAPCMGINLTITKTGSIHVGDPVYAIIGEKF